MESLDSTPLALNGGGGNGNTVAGSHTTATTFTTDGAGNGTLGGVQRTYSGFANLQGNSGADTLQGPASSTDSPIDWTVTGTGAGTLGSISFTGFAAVDGLSGADTLTGPNSAATWTVTGTGTGSVDGVAFSGIVTILGGSGTQTIGASGGRFTIAGNNSGDVDGTAFTGFQSLAGQGTNNILFEPCPGTPSAPSGTCGAISYSGMQTVTNQAPSTYTFRGSSGADTIIIGADPGQPGYLRIVDNGTTTNFADPTGTLQILGLGGTDTITVDALDAGFNGNLDIYGTAALALGDLSGPATAFSFSQIHHADEALFGAEGLSVEIAGAVGLGAGNFVALVQTFTVDSSASLSTAGTVNVLAEDIATTPETVVFVSTRSASISIGDHATISAASVSLVAYSWDGGNLSEQAAAATPSPAGQDAL